MLSCRILLRNETILPFMTTSIMMTNFFFSRQCKSTHGSLPFLIHEGGRELVSPLHVPASTAARQSIHSPPTTQATNNIQSTPFLIHEGGRWCLHSMSLHCMHQGNRFLLHQATINNTPSIRAVARENQKTGFFIKQPFNLHRLSAVDAPAETQQQQQ